MMEPLEHKTFWSFSISNHSFYLLIGKSKREMKKWKQFYKIADMELLELLVNEAALPREQLPDAREE